MTMKQKATVVKAEGTLAVISVMRSSMCDGCHKNCDGGCSMHKIFGGDKKFEAEALNKIGAEAGDRVYVETPDKDVLSGAFLVFILPLIIAFVSYAVADIFFESNISFGVAFGVFILYYVILAVTESVRRKKEPPFIITEVIKQ